jgi:hypothetical protein
MDAPLIRLDQPVDVTVGALPGRHFPARIASMGPAWTHGPGG